MGIIYTFERAIQKDAHAKYFYCSLLYTITFCFLLFQLRKLYKCHSHTTNTQCFTTFNTQIYSHAAFIATTFLQPFLKMKFQPMFTLYVPPFITSLCLALIFIYYFLRWRFSPTAYGLIIYFDVMMIWWAPQPTFRYADAHGSRASSLGDEFWNKLRARVGITAYGDSMIFILIDVRRFHTSAGAFITILHYRLRPQHTPSE